MNPEIKLFLLCSIISFAANSNYSFSTTYLNIPINYFKDFIQKCMNDDTLSDNKYSILWNILLHCWFIGTFFGIWLSPLFNEKYATLVIFLIINLLSSILRVISIQYYLYSLLVISRITTGLASNVIYQTQIFFLQECSPASLRGSTSMLSGIWFSFMALLSIFLGQEYVFGNHVELLVIIASILSLISLVIIIPFKDTPKYLFLRKHDYDKALESIKFYFNDDNDQFYNEIKHEIDLNNKSNDGIDNNSSKKAFKKACILSTLACQNTVAFWSILLSSTDFLLKANLSKNIAEISTLLMAVFYFFGTVIGSVVISHCKRRTMVINLTSLNVLSLALYCIFAELSTVLHSGLKYGCLISLLTYGFTYGIGAGPVNRFIGVELVSQNDRSMIQAISTTINQVMVIITTFTILPLYNIINSFAIIVLFVIPSIISLIYLYFNLPETKGKNINDIIKDLTK